MAKFTPMLTAPSRTDKNFINYKSGGYSTAIPIGSDGYVMPNCVGWANGRLTMLLGGKINWKIPACNAEDWFDQAQKNGLKVGQTPKLGAVAVWKAGQTHNGADGAGHVAVVEQIKANGDIVTSNSAYGGTEFYTKEITKASGYVYSSNRPFLGFVYCGIEFEADTPSESTAGSIVAGKQVTLNNTKCYSSESAKDAYGVKSGAFYLWDATVKNGRIRITNAASRVGVAGQVTCWVAIADLNLATSTSSTPAYQCIHTVVKGDTLWALAVKYLDKGSRYSEIMKLNGLENTSIHINQKLKIPNK